MHAWVSKHNMHLEYMHIWKGSVSNPEVKCHIRVLFFGQYMVRSTLICFNHPVRVMLALKAILTFRMVLIFHHFLPYGTGLSPSILTEQINAISLVHFMQALESQLLILDRNNEIHNLWKFSRNNFLWIYVFKNILKALLPVLEKLSEFVCLCIGQYFDLSSKRTNA